VNNAAPPVTEKRRRDEVTSPHLLDEMVPHALVSGVGNQRHKRKSPAQTEGSVALRLIGRVRSVRFAPLVHANGEIQHAGVAIGLFTLCAHGTYLSLVAGDIAPLVQAELVGVLPAELQRHFSERLRPELRERVEATSSMSCRSAVCRPHINLKSMGLAKASSSSVDNASADFLHPESKITAIRQHRFQPLRIPPPEADLHILQHRRTNRA
jgi:hypothetical protein